MLTQDSLGLFYGSEKFTRYLGGYLLSEGALHVAKEGSAFWLMDAIISHQLTPSVARQEFQKWELDVQEDHTATLICDDGNANIVESQDIAYTDFPLPYIEFLLSLIHI